MKKWFLCLELLIWLRGYNASVSPAQQVPRKYLDALAEVVGEPVEDNKSEN